MRLRNKPKDGFLIFYNPKQSTYEKENHFSSFCQSAFSTILL